MNNPFIRTAATHRQGSALLIVLALLVLLTTLTIAFLSRSTLERQLSNASFSQSKVDLSGMGAVSTIISDLQQEIVAGSNGNGTIVAGTDIPNVTTSGNYYPNSPLTVVPALVGFTTAAGLENLLKISKNGYSFWPSSSQTSATNYTATGAGYYNANSAPLRASSISTLTASLNSRSVTKARWNKPLLLAPTSSSDYTPSSANFFAPDWIYVARDGSNPTSLDSSNTYLPNIAPTTATSATAGTNPITQRYAYAIYDEGSTLDMNVAGSPITSTSAVTYSANQPYKNALAYADLTQLPGINALSTAGQIALVNAFVGWRNFASSQLDQTYIFPNAYAFTPTNGTTFDQNLLGNTTGFLGVGGLVPYKGPNGKGSGNQTDNAFTSRQQLLQFMLTGLGQNSTFTANVPLSTLTSVMPYLGTFTRGLSQPSYQPPPLSTGTASTGRPAVLPAANGGNNAVGADDAVNPGFLGKSVQVTAAFTRNNGLSAAIGTPLVNKRFALSRLAWVTYQGPSAARNMTDADMVALINSNAFGNSTQAQAYLLEGTAANIQKYFGLDWDAPNNRWLYDYHNNGTAPATGSSGAIMKLGDIAALGAKAHDPDFFELLKASISVGSLGKSLTPTNTVPMNFNAAGSSDGSVDTAAAAFPPNYYYLLETSIDPQIIQIGANIIDQYQTAGYPTRIAFDNGALGIGGAAHSQREYVSVENYPYFYGVQTGTIPCVQPSGVTSTAVATDGIGVVTQFPIIWNPHDPNSSVGAVYPTNFRILADQTDPDTVSGGTSGTVGKVPASNTLMCFSNGSVNSNATSGTGSSGSALDTTFATYNPGTDTKGVNSTYHLASITNGTSNTSAGTASNSTIDITATGKMNTMFREPTLIMTAGSGSSSTAFSYGSTGTFTAALEHLPTDTVISAIPSASTAGIPCCVGVITNTPTSETPGTNQFVGQKYLGFYLGAFPMAWTNQVTPTPASVIAYGATIAAPNGSDGGTVQGIYITYRMQYQDPTSATNWITYDTKYGAPLSHGRNSLNWSSDSSTGLVSDSTKDTNDFILNDYTSGVVDPRTSRFGMFTHWAYLNGSDTRWVYRLTGYSGPLILGPEGMSTGWQTGWLDTTNNITTSFRMDGSNGYWFGGPYLPKGNTQYGQIAGWNLSDYAGGGPSFMHPGLLSQNCTQIKLDGSRFQGDGQYQGVDNSQASYPGGSSDYYADPDGVVRRADAGYVPPGDVNSPSENSSGTTLTKWGTADTTLGLPMTRMTGWAPSITAAPSVGLLTQIIKNTSVQTAGLTTTYALNPPSGTPTIPTQNISRPYILHRPFRSVGELGYAFSGTPWKNINFNMPESADSALLDVFTLNENYNIAGLEAGKINLNTRQPAVLAALLANAYLDDPETTSGGAGASAATAILGGSAALALANGIVTRTTDSDTTEIANGAGPFQNVSELVGKWKSQALTASAIKHPAKVYPASGLDNTKGFIDGMLAYKGFSGMPTPALGAVTSSSFASTSANPTNLMSLYTSSSNFGAFPTTSAPLHAGLPEAMAYTQRYHEAPIRALINGTQTRVWNLMIDVIAQTGRFPATAKTLSDFNVEGERRYWVHVAIDRYTGKVLDQQVEEVKE